MDLNQAYLFTKVIELGSFTKAAFFLGIPKSQVSRKVLALEKDLGVQLIYRTTRQIELTFAGKNYFQRCHRIMEELEALNLEVSKFNEDIKGTIRISAPEDMGLRFFPPIVEEFQKMHPKVRFEFYLTGRRVDLVKEPIDLALRVGKLQDSTLIGRKVGEVHNIIVASPEFLSKNLNLKNIEDLNLVTAVGFGEFGKERAWDLVGLPKKIKIRPNAPIVTNTMDMLLKLVLDGVGVSLIPTFIANSEIKSGKLIHLFKTYYSKPIPVHFVMPPQKEMPQKLKKFIEFASDKLSLYFI
jgi:LysR family transcriptional regulator for bpeEF and oprC